MTHLLQPNLLKLFAPRPPVPYLAPVARDPTISLGKKLSGVAAILEELREKTALDDAADDEANQRRPEGTATSATAAVKAKAAAAVKAEPDADGANGEMAVDGPAVKAEVKKEESVNGKDAEMEEGEEPGEVPQAEAPSTKAEQKTASSSKGLTYTEAEKYRQRVLERKRKREENFAKALSECRLQSVKLVCILIIADSARSQTSQQKTKKLWEMHTRRCSYHASLMRQRRTICDENFHTMVQSNAFASFETLPARRRVRVEVMPLCCTRANET